MSARRRVPRHIARPDYAARGRPSESTLEPLVPSADVLRRMRRACAAAARVLQVCSAWVRPGVTTDEIDAAAHAAYLAEGGYPSTLNYLGFPKSLCTSVNEVVCHGIPDSRRLRDGDLVNLDVTIFLEGVHGDCSATFLVGSVDGAGIRLVRAAEEALYRGIAAIRPGRPVRVVGQAIERFAKARGYGVVREFTGHAIGERFHGALRIPHVDDPAATQLLVPGMIFTVEPMLTEGSPEVLQWRDGWTVVTADGRRSAQFEHTVVVTDSGAEILTRTDA